MQLADAMRGVTVGIAWDRHILMSKRDGFTCVRDTPDAQVNGLSTALVDYSGYEFRGIDLLSGLGVSLTFERPHPGPGQLSYCADPSAKVGRQCLGLCNCQQAVGLGLPRYLEQTRLARWEPAPPPGTPEITVSALGDVPDRFRHVPITSVRGILGEWAASFFALIQEGGRIAFYEVGVDFDTDLQGTGTQSVELLEAG